MAVPFEILRVIRWGQGASGVSWRLTEPGWLSPVGSFPTTVFTRHHAILTQVGVPVPQFRLSSTGIEIEDLGRTSFAWLSWNRTADWFTALEASARLLARLHCIVPADPGHPVAARILSFLANASLNPPSIPTTIVQKIVMYANREHVLTHGDFQGSNLMWSGNRMAVIDIGALGLSWACYDIASILFDAHANMTQDDRREWLTWYSTTRQCEAIKPDELLTAAIARHIICSCRYEELTRGGAEQYAKSFERSQRTLIKLLNLFVCPRVLTTDQILGIE